MKLALVSFLWFLGFAAFAQGNVSLAPLSVFTLKDGREIVTDTNNITLYTFDVDNGTESRCYDSCAKAWPPLIASANLSVAAPLGLTERKDGSLQITLDGKPLYYFVGDGAPGDINGDGLQGVWHIITR